MTHASVFSGIGEQWKPIQGYEGKYEVSDMGNVRSLDYTNMQPHPKTGEMHPYTYKGQLIAKQKINSGYLTVGLRDEHGKCMYLVHRLVAEAFVPNPEGLPQVNHKDEKKTNNYADNLEWVTASDNCKYGHRNDTMIEQTSRKVERLMGNVIVTYNSIRSAAEKTGVSAAHICQCCKGERKTAGGTQWRYAIEIAEKRHDRPDAVAINDNDNEKS